MYSHTRLYQSNHFYETTIIIQNTYHCFQAHILTHISFLGRKKFETWILVILSLSLMYLATHIYSYMKNKKCLLACDQFLFQLTLSFAFFILCRLELWYLQKSHKIPEMKLMTKKWTPLMSTTSWPQKSNVHKQIK